MLQSSAVMLGWGRRFAWAMLLLLGTVRCSPFVEGDGDNDARNGSGNDASPGIADDGGAPRTDAGAPAYPDLVKEDSPAAYFRLGDRVTPVATDDGPNGHSATYKGDVELGVPGALVGDDDTAVGFSGVHGVVELASPDAFGFAGTSQFTIEAWVKRDGVGTGVLGKSSYSSGYHGWFLAFSADGTRLLR
jgi:hypothetical protein